MKTGDKYTQLQSLWIKSKLEELELPYYSFQCCQNYFKSVLNTGNSEDLKVTPSYDPIFYFYPLCTTLSIKHSPVSGQTMWALGKNKAQNNQSEAALL